MMDTQKFLRITRIFIKSNFPGCQGESVTIRFQSGEVMRIPVIGKKPACYIAGAQEQLADNELQVLAYIPDHDKQPASIEKIAKESGYRLNSWFRTILRRLRKKKKIVLLSEGYIKSG